MNSSEHPKTIENYRVHNVIGQGGMGVVYLAEDDRLQRQVAIKCINEHIADEVLTERLRHEAQLLAQLNHPNIVQVYDFIDNQDNLALVMEYVEGRTLRQYLRENLCDQKQKLLFLAQIADGLAAAHNAGIVHRDLKLDNILINRQGLLKLTDFGIAKSQDPDVTNLTQHDAVSGSYSAMSPEQIRGEKVGPGSDLFAFGILAWRILLGRHPFGDEAGQLLMIEKILNNTPQRMSETEADLPAELCQLIDSLLIKDPKQRPSSATWLARQLQVLLPQVSDELSGEMTAHNILRSDFNIPSPKVSYWGRFSKIVGFSLVLAVVAYIGIRFNPLEFLFKHPVMHIAVVEPELEARDPAQFEDLKASVFLALQDGVRSLPNSHLISPSEVNSARRSGGKLGTAVGADIVLSSQLSCEQQRCQLTLSELSGDRWAVQQQNRQALLNKKLLEVHGRGQEAVRKLMNASGTAMPLVEVVSEADYQQFLELKQLQIDDSKSALELLDKLEAMQRRAPRFWQLYQLYADVSLQQYRAQSSEVILSKLQEILKKAGPLFSQSVDLHEIWFDIYLLRKDYTKAVGSIELMSKLSLDPWDSERMLAQVEMARGDTTAAIEKFSKRLQLRSSSQAYRDLAEAYWKAGDKEEAVANVQESLKYSPEDMQSHSLLASIFMASGDFSAAKEMYLEILAKHPVVSVYESLGLLALLERDYSSAIDYFLKAKRLKPKERLYSLYLGDSYLLSGNLQAAQAEFENVASFDVAERNASELSYQARSLIQMGETMASLRILQKAQAVDASNKSVAFASALIYSKVGNLDSGLLWIESAIDIGVQKNWFALPWFDVFCEAEKSSVEFEKITNLSCPLQNSSKAAP
ncbi:serine/threonine-protein kinase [uncultured Pseudoteredinibacter sp.]|uniref:serine/threonine-protein kinase n=1 Tax=uncultured Pseudoteredinibacter sp. TaxID=1641701 RepID=UPI002626F4FC|nr:serine/threonine-protein kinase [uncultured Pseudoteredinibacter sp.]